ncbi:DUF4307 domain-containing protein [Desertihabitans brevis]|uniref:DUF4307 domain-containing protein n=1 Tax=Desertihabitans brevis TaxID=2268447 RepID=A0A367YXK6_9ACTN|nr:DUF4307 domain-containing protein [Desertihabitans brevis]RCK70626.1 DUF4307 domain-containing protein [Desertihabitans brevis]
MPEPVQTLTAADRERIRRRYPRSWFARPAGVAGLAVTAVLLLAWLVWAGLDQSTPAVSGRVDRYTISDTHLDVTVSIQRPDPGVRASCLLVASAQNFERVGEVEVVLPPGGEPLVQQDVRVRTFRRASTASLEDCSAG